MRTLPATPVNATDVRMARGSFLLLTTLAACGIGWSGVARAEDAEPREAPGGAEPSEPPPEEPFAPPAESPNAAAPSPEGVPAEGAPADAHPPELLHAIEPEYPPEAAAARLEATVVLRVDIDAEGTVTEAAVIEPAGHGFDEAARAAVLRLPRPTDQRLTRAVGSIDRAILLYLCSADK